jgi:oxygen-independent coproporphyrinogen-3 oxidase
VHVPLCRSKCAYCDFYSIEAASSPVSPALLAQLLLDQALAWLDRGCAPRALESLYIGGGTPTMLGDALPALVDRLLGAFGAAEDAEVTVEANPDSLDSALCSALASAGVTRVSLGVQSFDDAELALLGRAHDARAAARAAETVRESGLTLAIDLICGVPGSTPEAWRSTLERAVATGADHVSVYPLSLETGTPLAAAVLVGDVAEPDQDATAEAMLLAEEMLGAAGLERYEVANYARVGKRSRHNEAYWTGAEYIGVGPSAHGMVSARTGRAIGLVGIDESAARIRYAVASDLDEGLARTPRVDLDVLDAASAMREDAMLGLRRSEGIDDALASAAGVVSVLESLKTDGLVAHEEGRWRTTTRGWLLGNEVFGRVWNRDEV